MGSAWICIDRVGRLAGLAPALGRTPRASGVDRTVAAGALALVLTGIAAWIFDRRRLPGQGIHLTPVWQRDDWVVLALHTLGQTLNEEIVLGWILLTSLHRRLPQVSLPALALIVALIFAVLHLIFFAARPSDNHIYGILSAATVFSLFAVGTLRNNLILGMGSITLAWGVHLGWNLIFIGSAYTWEETGSKLAEPAIFNVVFGYTPIILLLTGLMGLSMLIFYLPVAKK
jgi:hypothetical protein